VGADIAAGSQPLKGNNALLVDSPTKIGSVNMIL